MLCVQSGFAYDLLSEYENGDLLAMDFSESEITTVDVLDRTDFDQIITSAKDLVN